ncbi:hypothetical protein PEX1_014870 [Penicillium expansum]|uniref:Uncharacterized protein n=1 Tax=Penicillium expansum TaxID=27334 RepID=A0A0A2K434_PENEN|nr:hypothetical protein PEX2_017270 [Penicillium expansum]KGO38477.1 hypothetical protein PEXP_055550 [Penicillium expansum]KGO61821.1 hypothetical protein PEX2_017270 [Penicillium expansum]KGO67042.1 hypothetical protein PEX1_014870 [Penicillium expansum]
MRKAAILQPPLMHKSPSELKFPITNNDTTVRNLPGPKKKPTPKKERVSRTRKRLETTL